MQEATCRQVVIEELRAQQSIAEAVSPAVPEAPLIRLLSAGLSTYFRINQLTAANDTRPAPFRKPA